MPKPAALICASLASLSLATPSNAAPSGGDFALGVERMFGFSYYSTSVEADSAEAHVSGTSFSLGTTRDPLAYSAPRVGLDYFLDSGLTLGLAVGWATVSRKIEGEGRVGGFTVQADFESESDALLLAPRAGFLLDLNETFTLWPRGGITYLATSADPPVVFDEGNDTALTLEAPVIVFIGSLGLWGGPVLDVGISGSRSSNGSEIDADVTTWEIGLQFGLFGVL